MENGLDECADLSFPEEVEVPISDVLQIALQKIIMLLPQNSLVRAGEPSGQLLQKLQTLLAEIAL